MANTEQGKAIWTELVNNPPAKGTAERAAFNLASENADDSMVEEGFESFSDEWFYSFASSYKFALDTMNDHTRESWSF
jgi:hypothetical protein